MNCDFNFVRAHLLDMHFLTGRVKESKFYEESGRVRAADMSPNMIPLRQLMRLMTIIGGLM